MKMKVLILFASPNATKPTMKPIEIARTLNSLTFVIFCNNLPKISKVIPIKYHNPR